MCVTCGCEGEGAVLEGGTAIAKGQAHGHAHHHHHDHDHGHHHDHPHDHAHDHNHAPQGQGWSHAPGVEPARRIAIERDILAENDGFAAANRQRFATRRALALNLVSSPGSGKTSLLVRSIQALQGRVPVVVVEGDQQTSADADRIRAAGAPAVQINTGKGCHLDAHMVGHALNRVGVPQEGIVFIENVGNLVCPASFDLGEYAKVAVLSVTEGEDKPLKYPDIFAAAGLVLLNKLDLAPHVDADLEAFIANARRVNPGVEVLPISSRTGEGFDAWLDWLLARRPGEG